MSRAIIGNRAVTATAEQEIGKNWWLVAPGVWRLKDVFVNTYIIQNTNDTDWILVDAGFKSGSADKTKELVAEVFGTQSSRPSAIVLTHGHFDHVGALTQLADEWDVPVYCHKLERPFLTGSSKYPPADPSVGGGLMSFLSWTFPRSSKDVEQRLQELPEEGTLSEMPEWKWLHTPGHTPGHISLYRESDGVLIAGDAICTTDQHSIISVATQKKEMHGPPMYFTIDWGAAARSVKSLASLQPQVIATGHGPCMYGAEARKALNKLSRQFWDLGMPQDGRYVHEPALANEDGITYIPPKQKDYTQMALIGLSAFAVALGIYYYSKKRNSDLWSDLKRSAMRAFDK